MEWLLGLIVAFEVTFWQYVLSAGVGVIIGMILLRIIVPATLLAAFSAVMRRMYERLHRPAIA
jgi:flagellar motor component MotA